MELKLFGPKTVTRIEIVARGDGNGEKLKNLEIRAGSHPVPSGNVELLEHNERVAFWRGPGKTGKTYKIDFICPKIVEYITMQIIDNSEGDNGLHINEVTVFGYNAN